ncbi:hypothetical protein AYO44_16200 [Planctomycetaceae bacterium SCGC AG-212-F19]|nr:hypothetical protein AYO44_16200 [Planctomycetaceae bacterium SCGC AG-212-F19]
MTRRRWLWLCLTLFGAASFMLPAVHWRVIGWVKGEAFYQGRPTSYWAKEIEESYQDEPKDKKAELKKAIEEADRILVGKVTTTDLIVASCFSVGEIEATKVLKGDEKSKSVRFKYPSRVTPTYAKVGVEGVWILSKANPNAGGRNVLSFQPLAEEETVKALLKEQKK